MKKVTSYTATFLTVFTLSSGIPVLSGGCNTQMNKSAKVECSKNDSECKKKNTEKYKFDNSVRS